MLIEINNTIQIWDKGIKVYECKRKAITIREDNRIILNVL